MMTRPSPPPLPAVRPSVRPSVPSSVVSRSVARQNALRMAEAEAKLAAAELQAREVLRRARRGRGGCCMSESHWTGYWRLWYWGINPYTALDIALYWIFEEVKTESQMKR